MSKIRNSWGWLLLTTAILSYPLTVMAALASSVEVNEAATLSAPFTIAWLGVWVFSAAGGICAGFINITDIDERLNHPRLAKAVIGLFWGVALCTLIDTFTSIPQSALTFFAIIASCFSAPVCAGLMVYLSNQKRLNSAFDALGKRVDKNYTPIVDEDSKNDASKL